MSEKPLDRIDVHILETLQNNGRISNRDLSKEVGLSPSSTIARVRQLTERGAIRGFSADIEPSSLGVGLQALIALRMANQTRELLQEVRQSMQALPEVLSLFHLAGEMDFMVHVAVRDANHLRDVVMDKIASLRGIGKMETHLVFDHDRKGAWPVFIEPKS